jgi:exopolyphosphatase/guanosine-5'-triphosphate,3'-diphosphate pyrophosphatase
LDKVAFVEHQPAPAPGQCMGVIDIGSNTCRLVVARVLPGLSFEIIDEERQSLRLAPPRPGDPIPEETLTRAEAAMRAFRQVAASHQCASVWPLATSGVREAANGEEARQRLAAALGAEVITVSSDEEGRLALNAALRSTALRDGALLDVGGGSLQVVYVRNGDHLRTVSHPDGALRLTRRLLRSDPPSKSERDKLASLLKRDLKELEPLHGGEPLYVTGGAARTLARVLQRRSPLYPMSRVHQYEIRRADLEVLVDDLGRMTVAEKQRVPGLREDRADILYAGAAAILAVARRLRVESLTVCGQGLREGLLYWLIGSGSPPAVSELRRRSALLFRARLGLPAEAPGQVEEAAMRLHELLEPQVDLEGREILSAAAILADVGSAIGYGERDRHAEYLITHGDLQGFSQRELMLIAKAAGSQRKLRVRQADIAPPLEPPDARTIERLSSILAVAGALRRFPEAQPAVSARKRRGLEISSVPEEAVLLLEEPLARLRAAYGVEATVAPA